MCEMSNNNPLGPLFGVCTVAIQWGASQFSLAFVLKSLLWCRPLIFVS